MNNLCAQFVIYYSFFHPRQVVLHRETMICYLGSVDLFLPYFKEHT